MMRTLFLAVTLLTCTSVYAQDDLSSFEMGSLETGWVGDLSGTALDLYVEKLLSSADDISVIDPAVKESVTPQGKQVVKITNRKASTVDHQATALSPWELAYKKAQVDAFEPLNWSNPMMSESSHAQKVLEGFRNLTVSLIDSAERPEKSLHVEEPDSTAAASELNNRQPPSPEPGKLGELRYRLELVDGFEPLNWSNPMMSEYPASLEYLIAGNGIDPFEVLGIPTESTDIATPTVPEAPTKESDELVFPITSAEDRRIFDQWYRQQAGRDKCAPKGAGQNFDDLELIRCLDLIGFSQAQISRDEGIAVVILGPRFMIEDVSYAKVFDVSIAPANSFTKALSDQPLSIERHTQALERLSAMGFVKDPVMDYFELSDGSFDAELGGEPAMSKFSLGASLLSGGGFYGAIRGRHLFEQSGLRYLDYKLSTDAEGNLESSVTTPIYYDIDNVIELTAATSPTEFEKFDSRSSGVRLDWNRENSRWLNKDFSSSITLAYMRNGLSGNDKSNTTYRNLDSYGHLELSGKLNFPNTLRVGDLLEVGVSANRADDADFFLGELNYTTNYIDVGETGLLAVLNFGTQQLSGDLHQIPVDQRLYLGGNSSLRGVRSNFIGSADDENTSGGDFSAYGQAELLTPLVLFGRPVKAGFHLDSAIMEGDRLPATQTVTSAGLVGRASLSDQTEVYVHLSRADNKEGSAKVGLGIKTDF